MVLGPLAFLSLLGIPLLFGAAVLRALGIGPSTDRLAHAGWAWTVGALGTGAAVFLWLLAQPQTTSPIVPVVVLVVAAVGLFLVGRRLRPEVLPPPPSAEVGDEAEPPGWETWLFRVAVGLVLAVVLVRILHGTTFGVVSTDEAHFWTFRAKLLFHEGGFGPGYAEAAVRNRLANADYPLLNPLLQVWTFAHAGAITHVVNRLPIQLFSLALVLILSASLRRVTRPGFAALLILLLPSMRDAVDAARLGYSDLAVALGALMALDAIFRWRADGERAWIALASLAVAFMLWSKHEGALLLVAGLAAAAIHHALARRKRPVPVRWRAGLPWIVPPIAVLAVTWGVNAAFGASNEFLENRTDALMTGVDQEGNFLTNFVTQLPERFVPLLRYFTGDVFLDPAHSQYVFVAFAVLLVAFLTAVLRGALRFSSLLIVIATGGLVAVFVGLPHELEWHLETAASRVAFQVVPLVLLWIGALSGRLGEKGRGWRILLILFLVSRAGAATYVLVRDALERTIPAVPDAFRLTERERIERGLDLYARVGLDQLYRASYDAVIEHVPADGEVLAVLAGGDERAYALDTLRLLTYPRRFELRRPPREPIPPEVLEEAAGRVWVLDLADSSEWHGPPFAEIASGPGWSLWH